MKNRKACLFVFSVIMIFLGALFRLEISTGVVSLYTIYCVGNVSTKFSRKALNESSEG